MPMQVERKRFLVVGFDNPASLDKEEHKDRYEAIVEDYFDSAVAAKANAVLLNDEHSDKGTIRYVAIDLFDDFADPNSPHGN